MSNCRTVAQRASVILVALTMSACLMNSGGSGWSEQPGAAQDGSVGVVITNPTSAAAMDTTDESLSLGGTASSDQGVSRVTWQNDRGGSGLASGTNSWQVANIALELGENTIAVTAEDNSGESSTRTIVVNRESGEEGSTTLSWNAPTLRVDGSPLNNLAGYKIYFGRMSGIYDYTIEIDNPGLLTFVVENLVPGEWFFALAAYDTDGMESELSSEVQRRIS